MSDRETKPVLVCVLEPDTNEVLEEKTLENDFLLLCHGRRYLSGEQHYPGTGTTILTIKTRRATS